MGSLSRLFLTNETCKFKWRLTNSCPSISRQCSFQVACSLYGLQIKEQKNSFPVTFSVLEINLQKFTIFPIRLVEQFYSLV